MKIINQFKKIKNIYGNSFAIKAIIIRLFSREKYNRYIFKKINSIYSSTAKLYSLNKYYDNYNTSNEEKINIWVFWWQGLENAPDVVKKCIDTIQKKFDKEKFKLNIITKSNIYNYCDFPEYIYRKVFDKIITLTHFSDLIRADLLYRYGGLWIDATVLVINDIKFDYFEKYDFFTLISKSSKKIINSRWTGFFMYSKKGYPLWKYLHECFLDYWKNNDFLIAYLFIDFLIAVYDKNSVEFQNDLDKIPYTNFHLWSYLRTLNKNFDINEFTEIKSDTDFLKLSYKNEINHGNLQDNYKGKLTKWGYIKKNL